MDLSDVGRVLIALGLTAVVVGGVLLLGARFGLGHLPGDVSFRAGNVRVYAPLATSLLLSVVLTVVINLIIRR